MFQVVFMLLVLFISLFRLPESSNVWPSGEQGCWELRYGCSSCLPMRICAGEKPLSSGVARYVFKAFSFSPPPFHSPFNGSHCMLCFSVRLRVSWAAGNMCEPVLCGKVFEEFTAVLQPVIRHDCLRYSVTAEYIFQSRNDNVGRGYSMLRWATSM